MAATREGALLREVGLLNDKIAAEEKKPKATRDEELIKQWEQKKQAAIDKLPAAAAPLATDSPLLQQLARKVDAVHALQVAISRTVVRHETYILGWSSSVARTEPEQEAFKEQLISHWECADPAAAAAAAAAAPGVAAASQRIKCMLVNQLLPRSEVKAAHVWPYAKRDQLDAFRLLASNINDVRNGLLLCSPIEKAFDRLRLTFVYNPLEQKFRLRVMDPQLSSEQASSTGLTFAQIDHWPLQLPAGKWPYRRIFYYHLKRALHKWNASLTPEEQTDFQTLLDLSGAVNQPDGDMDVALAQDGRIFEADELQQDSEVASQASHASDSSSSSRGKGPMLRAPTRPAGRGRGRGAGAAPPSHD